MAYLPLLWTSGLAWSAAFGLFAVHYGRHAARAVSGRLGAPRHGSVIPETVADDFREPFRDFPIWAP